MNRGELWWADVPEPRGSEPGFRRPVPVIQADGLSRSRLRTVICAALASNTRLAEIPGNVLLNAKDSNLSRDSVINVTQIITLDRSYLAECVGTVTGAVMRKVEEGLMLALDLS
jgi:mRNA interferase MazF